MASALQIRAHLYYPHQLQAESQPLGTNPFETPEDDHASEPPPPPYESVIMSDSLLMTNGVWWWGWWWCVFVGIFR